MTDLLAPFDLLSDHLTVAEFLATSRHAFVAEQDRFWRDSPELRATAQRRFAGDVFEPTRGVVVRAGARGLRVTSGLRCPGLNSAVGGRPTSRHVLGLAADVQPIGMGCLEAMRAIAAALENGELAHVDQVILEMGWIHLQAAPATTPARLLALETNDGAKYRPFRRIA